MDDLYEKYLIEYNNVSREELERIREYTSPDLICFIMRSIHREREREKIRGRPALNPGPLIHVLSVSVESGKNGDGDKPLVIHGRIIAQNFDTIYGSTFEYELYNRNSTNPETLDKSGALSLSGPDYICNPNAAFIPMFKNRMIVNLFDGDNNPFARECFSLEDTLIEGCYEEVKSMYIPCERGLLTLKYVAIPLGMSCRIEIKFHNKKNDNHSGKREFINLNGKVVASFVDTCGNYNSEECILFQTESNVFRRVEVNGAQMELSRCWVAVPAYSSLVIALNLSDDAGRKLVNDSATFIAQPGSMYGKLFKVDDLFIQVHVSWFPPLPLRPHEGNDDVHQLVKCSSKTQEMDIDDKEEMDMEEDDDETCSDDETSSGDETSLSSIPWVLRPHKNKPLPSLAFEIYSVIISQKKSNASGSQIHGSIEVFSDDRICYVFKRNENEAFCLSENMNYLSILNGSRLYEDSNELEFKFDLKNVDGSLAIKGYRPWDAEMLEGTFYRDKQLCSVVQGQGGFVAVHYSIFSSAVAANVALFINFKVGCDKVRPKVYGKIVSQYRFYYYLSRYNKDYYRSVLFMKPKDGSVEVNTDGSIPLSRSYHVVPTYSPLIINVNLTNEASGLELSCTEAISIGDTRKTIETDDYIIHIAVDWSEVK